MKVENETGMPGQPLLVDGVNGARQYCKRIVDVDVRFAALPEQIATMEGVVACAIGDAIVMGTAGEIWPVERKTFEQKYEPLSPSSMGEPGRYRPVASRVLAVQLIEPLDLVLTGNRGTLHGDQGDWLIQYRPGERAIVSRTIFSNVYEWSSR
jgi:hypothetical protein